MSFRSEVINVLNNCYHTCIILNASYEGICVEFERKKKKHKKYCFLLLNCLQVLNIFYD